MKGFFGGCGGVWSLLFLFCAFFFFFFSLSFSSTLFFFPPKIRKNKVGMFHLIYRCLKRSGYDNYPEFLFIPSVCSEVYGSFLFLFFPCHFIYFNLLYFIILFLFYFSSLLPSFKTYITILHVSVGEKKKLQHFVNSSRGFRSCFCYHCGWVAHGGRSALCYPDITEHDDSTLYIVSYVLFLAPISTSC